MSYAAAHNAMMAQMMVMGMPKPGHSILACGARVRLVRVETGRLQ